MKWRANIALFVGTEVAYVAFFAATVQATPAIALTILALALAFTFPFLPIYLGLLAALPRHWSHRQLRGSAIGGSPLLLAAFVLFAFAGMVSLLLVALPGAMAYGALVRVPRRLEGATRSPGRPSPV